VWGLSVVVVVGLTAGGYFWNSQRVYDAPLPDLTVQSISTDVNSVDPLIELQGIEAEMKVWSSRSVFEEIADMETDEAENLLQLLQTEGAGVFREQ